MDAKACRILAVARWRAKETAPYFETGLLSLLPVEKPGLGTFACDERWHMYYDPRTVHRWAPDGLKDVGCVSGAYVHELFHVLRQTAQRGRAMAADHELFNIAADIAINPGIIALGLRLPPGALLPETYQLPRGKTAEWYYNELKKQGLGTSKGKKGVEEAGLASGRCGGCAGNPVPGEPTQCSGVEGRSDAEIDAIRKGIARSINEHARAHGQGSVPAEFVVWAESVLGPPQVDWRSVLRHVVRGEIASKAAACDFTYSRPSRRQAGIGYGPGHPVMATMCSYSPRVGTYIDTSGSMGKAELTAGMCETAAVIKQAGCPVVFMAGDAKVQEVKKVDNWKQAVDLLVGGGGTDFRPAFEAAVKQRLDVLVMLTDGMGMCPDEEPKGFRTIWVIIGKGMQCPVKWGKRVFIESIGEHRD